MSHEAVGRRYARAIFEIGKENKTLPQLVQDIGSFAAMYGANEQLRTVLSNPLVEEHARESILREIAAKMGISEIALSALRLLGKRRRLNAVADVAREIERLVDDDAGVLRASVTSAAPLSDAYLGKLRAELEKATGKKVVVVHRQDPSLVAGVVTRIGDKVIDGSVRARLSSFRDALFRS
jgi:F-type H+-transporting ATPase subunit delta